jgi:ornithine carbamoyltransferase/carbamoyltransferase
VDGPKLTVPALTPAHGPARNVISVLDLDRSTVAAIVRRAGDFFTALDDHSHPLAGKVVGTLFEKTSTRTRTAFLVGAIRLGAQVVTYGPNDLQTNTGESLEDTGRILGLMLDGLVARCARPVADVRLMARHAGIPVVSAMAVEEHPTQGLCDAAMLALAAGGYQNLKGLGLPAAAAAAATARSRKNDGEFVEFHDPADAAGPFDVVYATRWQTTGTTKTNPDWRLRFHGFRVDSVLMDRWPGSLFMHDLPAHRGEDVDSDVLDGARSLAWAQARMKLCSAMAVLEYAMA